MRIRIADIPPEGRTLQFDLKKDAINERVSLVRSAQSGDTLAPPEYLFTKDPLVDMSLMLEGSTVVVSGRAQAEYLTPCSRCAEETKHSLEIPLDLVLKPHSERSAARGAEEEDLHFGIYDGEEVDCSEIAEEFLVLGLPFTVLCDEECKGLCPQCGKNLNSGSCECKPEPKGDPRLSALRELKIH